MASIFFFIIVIIIIFHIDFWPKTLCVQLCQMTQTDQWLTCASIKSQLAAVAQDWVHLSVFGRAGFAMWHPAGLLSRRQPCIVERRRPQNKGQVEQHAEVTLIRLLPKQAEREREKKTHTKKQSKRWLRFPEGRPDDVIWHSKGSICHIRRFWEETVTWSGYILNYSTFPLTLPLPTLPVGYMWPVHTILDTLSTFFFVGFFEDVSIHPQLQNISENLNCPHQVSLEISWCKMAANW